MFNKICVKIAAISSVAIYTAGRFHHGDIADLKYQLLTAKCDDELQNENTKILKFASIYFRHGTRTPLSVHPIFGDYKWPLSLVGEDPENLPVPYKMIDADTNKEEKPYSYYDEMYQNTVLNGGCTAGKLTIKGQYDSLNLGKKLKKRYADELGLLPDIYDSQSVLSYSTNFKRTIESMNFMLKGFFGDSINESNVAVIKTRRNEIDYNFPNQEFCKSLGRWVNYVYKAQYAAPRCDKLLKKLKQIIKDESQIPTPLKLRDNVASLKSNGMELPKEYDEIYEMIEQCASHVEKWAMYGEIPRHMKLSFGKVLDDIMCHMENVVSTDENEVVANKKYPKVQFTACHDTTILALVTAMGGFDEKWPELSCYLAFEVFKDTSDNKHYVRVVYNDDVIIAGGMDKNGFIELNEFLHKYDNIRMRKLFFYYCNDR